MCIFNSGLITFRLCSLLLVQNVDVESHNSRRLTCHSYSVIFVSLVKIHHYGSTCILRWCLILSVANIISHYQWCNKLHPKQNSPFTFPTLTVSWQQKKRALITNSSMYVSKVLLCRNVFDICLIHLKLYCHKRSIERNNKVGKHLFENAHRYLQNFLFLSFFV